jgi:hypothetical protein
MFYGFNFGNFPAYSRLFSQPVMQRAQDAYTQGMSQYNAPQRTEPQRQEQPVAQASNAFFQNLISGQGQSLGNKTGIAYKDGKYNLSYVDPSIKRFRSIQVDEQGNPVGLNMQDMNDDQINALMRLRLAQSMGVSQ